MLLGKNFRFFSIKLEYYYISYDFLFEKHLINQLKLNKWFVQMLLILLWDYYLRNSSYFNYILFFKSKKSHLKIMIDWKFYYSLFFSFTASAWYKKFLNSVTRYFILLWFYENKLCKIEDFYRMIINKKCLSVRVTWSVEVPVSGF